MNAVKNLTIDLVIAYSRSIVFEEFAPEPDEIDRSIKIDLHSWPSMKQSDAFFEVAGWRFFTVTDEFILLYNKL